MFNDLKEIIDSYVAGDTAEEIGDQIIDLEKTIQFIRSFAKTFDVKMPEYPENKEAQEAFGVVEYAIDDARHEIKELIKHAEKQLEYLSVCLKETEEEENDRIYGTHEQQVKREYDTSR